jgi:hypothetical protein
MANEIIPYLEMCRRESASLQRGMNFDLGKGYSVILMSRRRNAPYRDHVEDEGLTLIYEGHDSPRHPRRPDPKSVDQPELTPKGTFTENGKFLRAVLAFQRNETPAPLVRVYEKIHEGIWSFNGVFFLIDGWRESDGRRLVFKFKLTATAESDSSRNADWAPGIRSRLIPTEVKLEVWSRDKGQCVRCGASDELHFDHVLPFSKGGTSLTAGNIQLLCARHNLSKGAKII